MTHSTLDPVLRRKIVQRAPAPETTESAAPAVVDGPAAALVRSFARAVSEAAPLVAEGGQRKYRRLNLAELLDSIDPESYVGLLGSDGASGIAVVDQSGFTSMVEAMTTGRLATRPVSGRRATTTDSALLGEVLGTALAGLDSADPARWFHVLRPIPDHRMLPILLDEVEYAWVSLEVSLVSGKVSRDARLALALPVHEQETDQPQTPDAQRRPNKDAAWCESLEASVMAAPASLRAELGRLTLPLSEVLKLGVDSTLTLPLSNLEEVRLAALDGQVHALGRLGQSRGMRAIRLTSWPNGLPPEPDTRFQPGTGSESHAPVLSETHDPTQPLPLGSEDGGSEDGRKNPSG